MTRDCPQCHDLVLDAPENCGVYQPHNRSMPFNCFGFEKRKKQEQKQESCSGLAAVQYITEPVRRDLGKS